MKICVCYKASELATYIIKKCIKDDNPISNIVLQKILFIIQKEFLKDNKIAFFDNFVAMGFGPCILDIYYKYCGFGVMPIAFSLEKDVSINENDIKIIDSIIENNRNLAPWEFSKFVQKPCGAWEIVWNHGEGNEKIISNEMIKELECL